MPPHIGPSIYGWNAGRHSLSDMDMSRLQRTWNSFIERVNKNMKRMISIYHLGALCWEWPTLTPTLPGADPLKLSLITPSFAGLYVKPANCSCIVLEIWDSSTTDSRGSSDVNSSSKLVVSYALSTEGLNGGCTFFCNNLRQSMLAKNGWFLISSGPLLPNRSLGSRVKS